MADWSLLSNVVITWRYANDTSQEHRYRQFGRSLLSNLIERHMNGANLGLYEDRIQLDDTTLITVAVRLGITNPIAEIYIKSPEPVPTTTEEKEEKEVKGIFQPYLWVGVGAVGYSPELVEGWTSQISSTMGLAVFKPGAKEYTDFLEPPCNEQGWPFSGPDISPQFVHGPTPGNVDIGGGQIGPAYWFAETISSYQGVELPDDRGSAISGYICGPIFAERWSPTKLSELRPGHFWECSYTLDPEKTAPETFEEVAESGSYGQWCDYGTTWPAGEFDYIQSNDWVIPRANQILPGDYMVKIVALNYGICPNEGFDYTPVKAFVRVINGKGHDPTTGATGSVLDYELPTTYAEENSAYLFANQRVGGYPEDGPNGHEIGWWDGGFLCNVELGITSIKDGQDGLLIPGEDGQYFSEGNGIGQGYVKNCCFSMDAPVQPEARLWSGWSIENSSSFPPKMIGRFYRQAIPLMQRCIVIGVNSENYPCRVQVVCDMNVHTNHGALNLGSDIVWDRFPHDHGTVLNTFQWTLGPATDWKRVRFDTFYGFEFKTWAVGDECFVISTGTQGTATSKVAVSTKKDVAELIGWIPGFLPGGSSPDLIYDYERWLVLHPPGSHADAPSWMDDGAGWPSYDSSDWGEYLENLYHMMRLIGDGAAMEYEEGKSYSSGYHGYTASVGNVGGRSQWIVYNPAGQAVT